MKLSPRFEEALSYATRLHSQQERKVDGTPYVLHLLGVCSLVLEYGGGEVEAIAALLHDAVEDQGGAPRLREIRERFGDEVAAIVDGCSDTDQVPKPPWRERKENYIARLAGESPAVQLVSCADKLFNARSMTAAYRRLGGELWDSFNAPKEGHLWYYRALVETYRRTRPGALTEELARTVAELERVVSQYSGG
jgi:GTP pyrophosphokinase